MRQCRSGEQAGHEDRRPAGASRRLRPWPYCGKRTGCAAAACARARARRERTRCLLLGALGLLALGLIGRRLLLLHHGAALPLPLARGAPLWP